MTVDPLDSKWDYAEGNTAWSHCQRDRFKFLSKNACGKTPSVNFW